MSNSGFDFEYRCVCGHKATEHELRARGWAECLVVDCHCAQFEGEDTEPKRFYGIDITEERETIAEATILEDGTAFIEFVTVELPAAASEKETEQ